MDQSSLDTAIVSGFENVDASTSSTAVSLTGDANANVLSGGTAADVINGGSGADTLDGGAGNDTIDGGDGDDTIFYDGSNGWIVGDVGTDNLVVTGAATITLSLADQTSGDTANVSGFENVDASGSSAAVSLTGDSNANALTGGFGS